ncbi:LytTR family two component transcriptional regulator [Mucilaginibacter yixingensis]|uniref:LytTR family two component transcriptional regulator n=1 Tax=Mucilaginibacter yixingensis TaxID=1295612 RepID=A0A2T5JBF6_9SPHI|nr:LytTR family DNA-binding domain-containing protein [Mucilaginibacter yixingensis]PTQ98194.1 LytTR family two component transcriptional regulator [Mucilaginibacter yixingensis]
MKLNCIAIDDEPLALGLISTFISQTPFLNLAGTYSSAVKAMEALGSQEIQLIFLDIQMPNLNGIELARLLHQTNQPKQPRIIFTTAYNQFAVDSYRVDALDYLLKPFDYEDFLRAANKALTYYSQRGQQPAELPQADYIFVRVEYQLVRIALDDILYVEGLKDYLKIHLASTGKAILTLMTMKSLEEKLPSQRFMRVQRSFIVALDKISAITKHTIRVGETEITIGEQYKPALQEFLSKWL